MDLPSSTPSLFNAILIRMTLALGASSQFSICFCRQLGNYSTTNYSTTPHLLLLPLLGTLSRRRKPVRRPRLQLIVGCKQAV